MFVRLVLCVGVCCTYFFFYITSPEHPPSVGRHRKDNDDVAGRTCLHRGRRCDGELSTAAGCRIAIATPDFVLAKDIRLGSVNGRRGAIHALLCAV